MDFGSLEVAAFVATSVLGGGMMKGSAEAREEMPASVASARAPNAAKAMLRDKCGLVMESILRLRRARADRALSTYHTCFRADCYARYGRKDGCAGT